MFISIFLCAVRLDTWQLGSSSNRTSRTPPGLDHSSKSVCHYINSKVSHMSVHMLVGINLILETYIINVFVYMHIRTYVYDVSTSRVSVKWSSILLLQYSNDVVSILIWNAFIIFIINGIIIFTTVEYKTAHLQKPLWLHSGDHMLAVRPAATKAFPTPPGSCSGQRVPPVGSSSTKGTPLVSESGGVTTPSSPLTASLFPGRPPTIHFPLSNEPCKYQNIIYTYVCTCIIYSSGIRMYMHYIQFWHTYVHALYTALAYVCTCIIYSSGIRMYMHYIQFWHTYVHALYTALAYPVHLCMLYSTKSYLGWVHG